MNKINAPFSDEQVILLNQYQSIEPHPFTCCSPENISECLRASKEIDGQIIDGVSEGILVATNEGWICPCGKYTQDWAYKKMLSGFYYFTPCGLPPIILEKPNLDMSRYSIQSVNWGLYEPITMEKTTFKFNEIGSIMGTQQMGIDAAQRIINLLKENKFVSLDFEGVRSVSNCFADTLISTLVGEHGLKHLKQITSFVNYNSIIKLVLSEVLTFHEKKIKHLNDLISLEWEKHGENVTVDRAIADKVIHDLKEKLLEIDYDKISVELTPLDSILFSLIFDIEKGERVITLIDKPFIPIKGLDENQAVVSIIRNGNLLMADILEIDSYIESTKKLRETMKSDEE